MHPEAAPWKPRVDAHHHLWHYVPDEFAWVDDDMQELRRDFLPGDLERVLAEARVDGTVVVQARQTVQETQWLLELAEGSPFILGVVGWLPLTQPDFPSYLDQFASQTSLVGLRHVVQAEPDGFLDDPTFNRNIATLGTSGLTYDLLLHERQLREAIRFVDRHPEQSFVLDHLAKPKIAAGEIEPWRTGIRELARRPHVTCKLSGMVTEADPKQWTDTQLRPYVDVVLEAFGPGRLMIGTDWPVLTLGCGYAQWWRTVEAWINPLSPPEQAEILGGTATRVYGLQTPAQPNASHPTTGAPQP